MNNNEKLRKSCDGETVPGEYFGVPTFPETVATTMAYVPFQTDTTQYTPETALKYGTLFPNLNKPFLGGACK